MAKKTKTAKVETADAETVSTEPNMTKPEGHEFDPAARAAKEREYERGADMPSYAEPKTTE